MTTPMQPEIEKIVKEARERILTSTKNGWTGGFEGHFFEDFLRAALLKLVQEQRGEGRRQMQEYVIGHSSHESGSLNGKNDTYTITKRVLLAPQSL